MREVAILGAAAAGQDPEREESATVDDLTPWEGVSQAQIEYTTGDPTHTNNREPEPDPAPVEPPPAAAERPRSDPGRAAVPADAEVEPAQQAEPVRATGAEVRAHAEPKDQPWTTPVKDPALLEPARRGWRGGLNRRLGLKLKPGVDEYNARITMLENERRDAENKAKLLRATTRTNGWCGFFTVASEKGGIGKTSVSAGLAYTLAQMRQENVLVCDLNPDRGNLKSRLGVEPDKTLRDLVNAADAIRDPDDLTHPNDFLAKLPGANVRVLVGETDARRREATSDYDVKQIVRATKGHFVAAILDNGTGISHAAMRGSLEQSQGMVIVLDNSTGYEEFLDGTLDYLKARGYTDLLNRVVLAMVELKRPPERPDYSSYGTNEEYERALRVYRKAMEKFETGADLAAKYKHKVRDVVVIPNDPVLAMGGAIEFDLIDSRTRRAFEQLAAALMDDLVA